MLPDVAFYVRLESVVEQGSVGLESASEVKDPEAVPGEARANGRLDHASDGREMEIVPVTNRRMQAILRRSFADRWAVSRPGASLGGPRRHRVRPNLRQELAQRP